MLSFLFVGTIVDYILYDGIFEDIIKEKESY